MQDERSTLCISPTKVATPGVRGRPRGAMRHLNCKPRSNGGRSRRPSAMQRSPESLNACWTPTTTALASLAKALAEYDKLNLAAETGTGMGGDVTVRVVYDQPRESR